MVALIEYPGASRFDYRIGTKEQCLAWLANQAEKLDAHESAMLRTFRVESNKSAKLYRWRNGFKVVQFADLSKWL